MNLNLLDEWRYRLRAFFFSKGTPARYGNAAGDANWHEEAEVTKEAIAAWAARYGNAEGDANWHRLAVMGVEAEVTAVLDVIPEVAWPLGEQGS